jgi:hypothetical protein
MRTSPMTPSLGFVWDDLSILDTRVGDAYRSVRELFFSGCRRLGGELARLDLRFVSGAAFQVAGTT